MAILHIVVTQHDIDFGDGGDDKNCMCYRAISRVLPNHEFKLGINYVFFRVGEDERGPSYSSVLLPPDVAIKVEDHYNTDNVEAFEFDWEVPDNIIQSSERQGI